MQTGGECLLYCTLYYCNTILVLVLVGGKFCLCCTLYWAKKLCCGFLVFSLWPPYQLNYSLTPRICHLVLIQRHFVANIAHCITCCRSLLTSLLSYANLADRVSLPSPDHRCPRSGASLCLRRSVKQSLGLPVPRSYLLKPV